MNIVPIREANALALDNSQVAHSLREAARWIEAGEYGEVSTVVMVIEYGDGQLARLTFGQRQDRARVVGLLSMMKSRIERGVDE